MKYAYSYDEENFTGEFDSPEAAAEEAFDNDPEMESVYVGEVVKEAAHAFVNARLIVENLQEQAADDCGEWAEDWLEALQKNKEKLAELEQVVGDWIQEQYPPTFWTVKNVKEIAK